MTAKKLIIVTYFTIIFYILLRFLCWQYLSETKFWIGLNTDKFHHYQLGILLLVVAFVINKTKPAFILTDWLLAIGAGMIIDEAVFLVYPLNNQIFNHYHPLGLAINFLFFLLFSLIIWKYKK